MKINFSKNTERRRRSALPQRSKSRGPKKIRRRFVQNLATMHSFASRKCFIIRIDGDKSHTSSYSKTTGLYSVFELNKKTFKNC